MSLLAVAFKILQGQELLSQQYSPTGCIRCSGRNLEVAHTQISSSATNTILVSPSRDTMPYGRPTSRDKLACSSRSRALNLRWNKFKIGMACRRVSHTPLKVGAQVGWRVISYRSVGLSINRWPRAVSETTGGLVGCECDNQSTNASMKSTVAECYMQALLYARDRIAQCWLKQKIKPYAPL